jgi:hypothetical protein
MATEFKTNDCKMRKNLIYLILVFDIITNAEAQHWEGVDGGTEPMGVVFSLYEYDTNLIVAGSFSFVAGGAIPSVINGIWNGANWSSSSWNIEQGSQKDYAVYNNALHIGGNFLRINGNKYCNKVARLDSAGWQPLGSGVTNGQVQTMASFNGDLYVGGNFTIVDSIILARRIARWDGTNWNAIGNGFSGGFGDVFDMTVFQNKLYVGGDFTSIDGNPVSRICSWDGISWDSVNGGTNGLVFSLYNDTIANRLYVGGIFTQAGGVSTPTGVAYWDGTNWYPVGTNPFIPARNLFFFNGILYNGTTQSQAVNSNGDTLKYISWYDGINWNPMSGGLDGTCHTFESFGGDMYIGGTFTHAGDSVVNGIAKWIPGSIGVEEQIESEKFKMKVMPNPAKDEVKLEMNLKNGTKLKIEIMDVKGKLVFNDMLFVNGTVNYMIDTSKYNSGTYLISIYQDEILIGSEKVLIQR